MNTPTPAIVPQYAVRRLPLCALLALSALYVLSGFLGRAPWKAADITAFGYMLELTHSGLSPWLWPSLTPSLGGLLPEIDSTLSYAVGAWSIEFFTNQLHLLAADTAARIPFIFFLALTLLSTWHCVYYLALSPQAKPVQFAFGGQANSKDYALALADACVLALVATLGLAQLGHESTPTVAQLAMVSLVMLGFSMMASHPVKAQVVLGAGLFGLSLMGAPSLSVILGIGGATICALDKDSESSKQHSFMMLVLCLGVAVLSHLLHLWQWRFAPLARTWLELPSLGRLWIWFCWPVWPLTLWTLWRWRKQWAGAHWSRHLIIPLFHALVISIAAVLTFSQERTLLLALPAMAALAAFSLPTLTRGVKALIDWFTLLLFSGCAFVIWVIWIAYQTGWPQQPAKNVARLIPGFVSHFYVWPFILALIATFTWGFIVHWRVGRNPTALWKTLILPAGGAALCWFLVMSLWLPPVDYGRSYAALTSKVQESVGAPSCVYVWKLTRPQITALEYHANFQLIDFQKSDQLLSSVLDQVREDSAKNKSTAQTQITNDPLSSTAPECSWLLVNGDQRNEIQKIINKHQAGNWSLVKVLRKPSDPDEDLVIFRHIQ